MRLNFFLNKDSKTELDTLLPLLKENCSEILDFYSKENRFLYRSIEKNIKVYLEKTPRENRKPSNTSIELHNMYDKLFKKKFGWPVRSEGVFATPDRNKIYGEPYLFFPFNGYKYVWSTKIIDLFTVGFRRLDISIDNRHEKFIEENGYTGYTEDYYYKWVKNNLDLFENVLMDKVINTYQDNNLKKATYQEITFKCSKYYLVNVKYMAEIMEFIKGNK